MIWLGFIPAAETRKLEAVDFRAFDTPKNGSLPAKPFLEAVRQVAALAFGRRGAGPAIPR